MASDADDRNFRGADGPQEREEATRDPDTVRLLAEEVSVGVQEVETGRVRVRVTTDEHEETVEVPLKSQRIEVERVPIGKEVDAIPPRRQEGDTTIVPVVEEVIVRKLVLKEEVRLTLVQSTEQHRERVVLHKQNATVERVSKDNSPNNTENG